MTGLLSIARRELAVGARQTSTHRGRFIAGAIVVAFFGLFLALQSYPPNVLGPMLFSISSTLLFLQALLSGLRFTADSLSEEKREGTLGLLFLTELRSAEIVIGKMIVRSIRGFYGMIAMMPIFTFCILLGGVRGIDAFNTAALLIATMLFSLAAGIFVSSHAMEDKAAFLGTIGFLTAFSAIPPIVRELFFAATKSGAFDFLLYASPFYAMHTLPGTGLINWEFLRSIAGLLILATAFIALAAHHLLASFQHAFAETTRAKATPMPVLQGASRPRLESNPFRWLLERERLYPKMLIVFAIVVLGGSIIAVALTRKFGPGVGVAMNILYFAHFIWKTLVASDALRRLHNDRRSGALEQLLVTPLPVQQILSAQMKRTFSLFVPSAIALAAANFIFFTQSFLTDMISICIGGAVFLFIDARTLIWRAMLQALKPSRYPAAILRVTGVTLAPPICAVMLVMWSSASRGISTTEMNARFTVWFVGCAIYNAILIQKAKAKLKSSFRELAAEPLKSPAPKRPLPKPLQWLFLVDHGLTHSG